jgi:AcrR family transcriptional regulator
VPRQSHSQATIEETKERILGAATELMCRDGFDGLSMRKLARSVGMTAPNLYNYYANKNELYLEIQTHGFDLLAAAFAAASGSGADAEAQLVGMVRAYVAFGDAYPDLYDVMFGRNTPKYVDYVGTDMEPLARREKDVALTVIDLAQQVIERAQAERQVSSPTSARLQAMEVWCTLHGLVSLRHTRVLAEVIDDPEELVASIVDRVRRSFHGTSPAPAPRRSS